MNWKSLLSSGLLVLAAVVCVAPSAHAQVGKSVGIVDANTVAEADLARLPHMTPDIARALVAKRPFASVTDLNAFLLEQKLTQAQANEFYGKAFVHVNLNTGTREEFLLVPNAGTRMAREFAEYRPWINWAQFDREIGKYVNNDLEVVNRYKQYLFIPIKLNTATDADILTIPNLGNRMLREFKEYRPWTSKAQFDREIGKYINNDPKELGRMWRFVVIDPPAAAK